MKSKSAIVVLGVLAVAGSPLPGDAWEKPEKENSSTLRGSPEQRLLLPTELVARIRQFDPEFPEELVSRGAIGCQIEDAFGNPVTTVSVLNQTGDPAYWLQYLSDGGLDQRVRFVVTPAFEGSPLAGQAQLFRPNDADNISTPFGIPFWGGNLTTGPWLLTVRNNRGGVAVCPFEVVP
jgi:hypothetical protein